MYDDSRPSTSKDYHFQVITNSDTESAISTSTVSCNSNDMYDDSRPSTSKDYAFRVITNSDTETAVSTSTVSCNSNESSERKEESYDEAPVGSPVYEPAEGLLQLRRSHSPYPTASSSSDQPETSSTVGTSSSSSENYDMQMITNSDTDSAASVWVINSSSLAEVPGRKRKQESSDESSMSSSLQQSPESSESFEMLPHETSFTNNYELFRNIRKQIDERRRGLFLVRPIPPNGFENYVMCRRAYTLAGTVPTRPNIVHPPNLPPQMKELFNQQETERYRLRMQHIIEQERFVLSVEQQILREHGRAARILTDQYLPFSVCTILRDEDVYNLITQEQEKRERKAGLAFSDNLFIKWLQDIDDKSEKVKNQLISRQNHEAEALYAVQKMDWEIKLRELKLWTSATSGIDPLHVPMV